MDRPELAVDSVSVVVRGHFNPAIFSPAWMFAEKLVGKGEFEQANVEVITSQIAVFTLDWLRVQVAQDHLQLSTQSPEEFERVRDAAVGVLKALPHTRILSLGINRDAHLPMNDQDEMNRVGDTLAPKTIWADVLKFPGLTNYQMIAAREDSYSGNRLVRVEPSNAIRLAIFVGHNDHYSLKEQATPIANRNEVLLDNAAADFESATSERGLKAAQILGEDWEESMTRADEVFVHVNSMRAV